MTAAGDDDALPVWGDDELEPEGEAAPGEAERFFQCPHCGQKISMLLDCSVDEQTLVEDCEVCCHPIEISYTAEDGKIVTFEARQA